MIGGIPGQHPADRSSDSNRCTNYALRQIEATGPARHIGRDEGDEHPEHGG